MSSRFVADVGGTNIRLAREVDGQIHDIKKYLCADYPHIADVIDVYRASMSDYQFSAGCIAIACPVNNDLIKMTNHSWQFSKQETRERLGLQSLEVINDFTAVSMCLPVLDNTQKRQIGGGIASDNAAIAVFGPGTGLGVSHLIPSDKGWVSLDGEGGHVDFAPQDDYDFAVWQFLRAKLEHVSAEEVLSGRGLVHVYQGLGQHLGQATPLSSPAEISRQGQSGESELAHLALAQFCRMLGSFAGNLALNLGTFGGVYVAGGVVQHFLDFLANSDFRARFEAKGRFKPYVQAIPTYVITEPDHGLIGAAAHLEQHLKG